MGKVAKLHRRLVKKHHEAKAHRIAVGVLLRLVAQYADYGNWTPTGETRDITQNGIVVGVEGLMAWRGPGSGPKLAERFLEEVYGNKPKKLSRTRGEASAPTDEHVESRSRGAADANGSAGEQAGGVSEAGSLHAR